MLEVLVVSDNMRYINDLIHVIESNLQCNITSATTISQAKVYLETNNYALVVANSFRNGDDCIQLALTATEEETTEVILIVDKAIEAKVSRCVEPHGVFVITKPISINLFQTVLRLAIAARKKVVKLSDDNANLISKLDDIKIVNRAKCCLIQYLGLSENEAHK